MSRFNGQELFQSGPHRFHVHGLSQRHVTHEQPGADGVRVTVMGRTGRSIDQTGTLLADNIEQLQQQIDTIEAAMDGQPAELIDDMSRVWSNTLMLAFKPQPIRRVGLRLAVDYIINYLQVQP